MSQLPVNKKQILDALDPFARLERISHDLNLPDDTPIRDFAPGVWPTRKDLKELYSIANLLSWTNDHRK